MKWPSISRHVLAWATGLLTVTTTVQAEVNLISAAYHWEVTLTVGSRPGEAINMAYQSRTLYNGLFGFGWCSALESRAEVQLDGAFEIIECGAGRTTLFERDAKASPKRDPVEVVARRGKDKFYTDLDGKKVMLGDVGAVRELLARGVKADDLLKIVGLKAPTLGAGSYMAADGSRASFDGVTLRVVRPDGEWLYFDAEGQLTEQGDSRRGRRLAILSRSPNALTLDVGGMRTVLELDAAGKARQASAGGRTVARFEYVKIWKHFVLSALKAEQSIMSFRYSEYLNMTERREGSQVVERIHYNDDKDWVVSVADVARGCTDTYHPVLQANPAITRLLPELPRLRALAVSADGKADVVIYNRIERDCGDHKSDVGAVAYGMATDRLGNQRTVAETSWFESTGHSFVEYTPNGDLRTLMQPPLALPSTMGKGEMKNALFSVRYQEPTACSQDLTAEGAIMMRNPWQPLPFHARAQRQVSGDQCVITGLEWQTREGTVHLRVERDAAGASKAIVLNEQKRWTLATASAPATGCSLRDASRETDPQRVIELASNALRSPCAPADRLAYQAALVFSLIQSSYTCACAITSATEHRMADFARWMVRGTFTMDQVDVPQQRRRDK